MVSVLGMVVLGWWCRGEVVGLRWLVLAGCFGWRAGLM